MMSLSKLRECQWTKTPVYAYDFIHESLHKGYVTSCEYCPDLIPPVVSISMMINDSDDDVEFILDCYRGSHPAVYVDGVFDESEYEEAMEYFIRELQKINLIEQIEERRKKS